MKTTALGAALMLLVCVTAASAEEPAAVAPAPAGFLAGAKGASAGPRPMIGTEAPEFGTLAKKTSYSLAALTIFFLLATGTIKRFSKKSTASDSGLEIEILSRKNLGPRQALMVVSVSGRSFFLSQSPEQVTLLSELDEDAIFRAASADDLELLENMKTSQRG